MKKFVFTIENEQQLDTYTQKLIQAEFFTGVVYLVGDLGVGKTTLVRSWLRMLGIIDYVKSPTFSLIESYKLPNNKYIYHFDLYRIHNPEELLFIGIEEYFTNDSLCLIEWPEHGENLLPPCDLQINLTMLSTYQRRMEWILTHDNVLGSKINQFLNEKN